MKPRQKRLLSTFSLSILLVLVGCANGYKEFYVPAAGITTAQIAATRAAPAPAVPAIFHGRSSDTSEIVNAYAQRGYRVIGHANFNSGRPTSDADAIQQAKEVGADIVLVLNPKHTGSVTTHMPFTTPTATTSYTTANATAYGAGAPVRAYGNATTTTYGTQTNYIPITINRVDYGAVFFVKSRVSLGLNFRSLNPTERQALQTNKGIVVTIVVDQSPAFDADVLVGDFVTHVDGEVVPDSEGFSALLAPRRGKKISLSISRNGQAIEKLIQLRM
ncbi:MAG: PDZ domain-containing protein [Pseudomonadota bacterium]